LKKSWFFIAVIVLLVLIYTYLGGFSKPQFEVVQIDSVVITGYDFKGLLTEKEFGNLFRKTDSLIEQKVLDGKAVGVFYNQPSTKDDTVQVFVGVLHGAKVPDGMTKKNYVLGKTLQATIKANYMLLPVNIYPKIIEYAQEQNLKISDMSYEIYESSDLLKIWVPIEEVE
jgi:effector-binding domain-containing protein